MLSRPQPQPFRRVTTTGCWLYSLVVKIRMPTLSTPHAEPLFPERKREAKMRPAGFLPAKSLAAQAAALLFLCLVPGAMVGSPSSALREYKAGQYDKALNEYHQLLQKKQDDPRLHFNAG